MGGGLGGGGGEEVTKSIFPTFRGKGSRIVIVELYERFEIPERRGGGEEERR